MAEERSATEAAAAAFRKGGWSDKKLAGRDGKEKAPRMSSASMRNSGGGSSGGGGGDDDKKPGPRFSSASAASGRSSEGPIRRG